MKGTSFEGAVRCVAALWSPLIARNKVSTDLMHLTDWLPTFYKAAGIALDIPIFCVLILIAYVFRTKEETT